MSIYNYEEAFGAHDKTSRSMRRAIREWFDSYYREEGDRERDPCQRIAYTVVSKLTRTVFGEYTATGASPFAQGVLKDLDLRRKEAMQLALVGGECYIKPCLTGKGFSFTLIPRKNVLIFGRDSRGQVTDVGTLERSVRGNHYYTLLERRRMDEAGRLIIENKLYRSGSGQSLGVQVGLKSHPDYALLQERYCYAQPMGSVGLVRLKTPMVNCVDGSDDGVSVYAAAMGLIRNIDRNEAQLSGEFDRGKSRLVVSADMLGKGGLQDELFVGLDEDPEFVGMTVFSPALREQSYLARKQEYLRNVESLIGLKRGMLSDANVDLRTATEISSSAGDYSLTVMDFQAMWEDAARKLVELCGVLGRLYGLEVGDTAISIDWGNGVLYDEDKVWEGYRQMVADGLLKPEIALGWRFGMPARTEEDLAAIRARFMPAEQFERRHISTEPKS